LETKSDCVNLEQAFFWGENGAKNTRTRAFRAILSSQVLTIAKTACDLELRGWLTKNILDDIAAVQKQLVEMDFWVSKLIITSM
jgi:hypothetical protein